MYGYTFAFSYKQYTFLAVHSYNTTYHSTYRSHFAYRNELVGYGVQLAHEHMIMMLNHFPQSGSLGFVMEEDFHLKPQVEHEPI